MVRCLAGDDDGGVGNRHRLVSGQMVLTEDRPVIGAGFGESGGNPTLKATKQPVPVMPGMT